MADLTVSVDPNKKTILLVEDEPAIMEVTATMLRYMGYKVLRAFTPSLAICLAKKYADEIHLLMTDVHMPEMSGRDLAGKILLFLPGMKILFMSGDVSDFLSPNKGFCNGVYVIQKPFCFNDLADILEKVWHRPA